MKTIIYYTANTEKPKFEKMITDNLKKQAGDIPIISVSKKPMDLGKNICVGDTPVDYRNSFKQILIGLKEAKTKFCIAAESDTLYPPEYFQFTPDHEDRAYRYTNLFVHFDGRPRFWRKRWVEAAQMCGTKHWIKRIEYVLKHDTVNPPFVFNTKTDYSWTSKNPALTFKTREGIGFKTGFIKGSVEKIHYWGDYDKIKEYLT